MSDETPAPPGGSPSGSSGGAPMPDAAKRALREAEARRQQKEKEAAQRPSEVGGRAGPDPARYGDWEKGGIASDF